MEPGLLLNNKNIARVKPKLGGVDTLNVSQPLADHIPSAFTEVWLVLTGQGKLITADGMREFWQGDIVICNPGARRGVFFDVGGEIKIFHLTFADFPDGGRLSETDILTAPSKSNFGRLKSLVELLEYEGNGKRPAGRYVADCLLRGFLAYIWRAFLPEEANENHNRVFLRARDYFDTHYLNVTSIDTVCKLLSINKFYLTHLFKENLGVPPIKYLIDKRMGHAKKLLASTGKSIAEVAADCAYDDVAYFCRVFKKSTGLTPLKYRRLAHA